MPVWDWWVLVSMFTGIELSMILCSYLLGCCTAGYYWMRLRTGQDIRRLGSGNVGARNVGRSLGTSGFAVTFFFDFLKGALAVWLARWMELGGAFVADSIALSRG
jgi:acyl phosphate:glycerol-3-phosphate acyltransferase